MTIRPGQTDSASEDSEGASEIREIVRSMRRLSGRMSTREKEETQTGVEGGGQVESKVSVRTVRGQLVCNDFGGKRRKRRCGESSDAANTKSIMVLIWYGNFFSNLVRVCLG